MATTTAPPEDTAPPADPPPAPPARGNRFFTWMRGLGLTRQPGWIGGVCAGIAARLGVDPLIVRGIVVVIAVLGGPALLLYAAGWLLLPDDKDKIHLEELTRGRFESPLAGIGALVLLSMLPIAQGFWYSGALYWGEPSWGPSFGRAMWTLVVLAAIVVFVIWIARRSSSTPSSAPTASTESTASTAEPAVTPATTDDRPETIPQPVAASAVVAAAPASAEPAPPPAGAPEEELAAWRLRQQAWKAERDQFRAQAAETARETARLRAQQARERSAAASAEYAERRRVWLAANPRAGAAYSTIALGAAALAGGVAAIVSPIPDQPVTVGLAVAAIVLGLAVMLAGALRRRSGFLSFVSVMVVIATLVSAVIPTDRILLSSKEGISNVAVGNYAQPIGHLYVTLDPTLSDGVIDVWQGTGTIDVILAEGMTARIVVESRGGDAWLDEQEPYTPIPKEQLPDGIWHWDRVFGDGATPTVTLRIWQGQGSIVVHHTPTDTETKP